MNSEKHERYLELMVVAGSNPGVVVYFVDGCIQQNALSFHTQKVLRRSFLCRFATVLMNGIL